jgi:dsDNA-specific endonuclease/ATPase MutS2
MTGSRRFHVGDHVHVAAAGKGIVREVRNGGRYLVDVKGRHLVAAEAQLTAGDQRQQQSTSPGAALSATSEPGLPSRPHVAASIDLHGLTADEAMSALDAFLSEAILGGCAEVRVIHGRSGGRLKAVVNRRLKTIGAVRSFSVDPLNPGVTVVTF